MEKVFASVWLYLEISVAVARTSQSPFPLAATLSDLPSRQETMKIRIGKAEEKRQRKNLDFNGRT